MSEKFHQGTFAGTVWNPEQYLKFSDHRIRPALELLARVQISSPEVIYDLGCGSGNITRIISECWSSATVYGLDNSDEMLKKAATETSRVKWVKEDIGNWSVNKPIDLIYSNSTLQWLNQHNKVFPKLLGMLKKGGCLAVQMPLSWGMPSHRLMRETLANGGINGAPIGTEELRNAIARKWVEDKELYYDFLFEQVTQIDIWETEYLQILTGEDPVLEWVRGTGLRPILNTLDNEERAIFLSEYSKRLRKAYPVKANGQTLFPFRRLFIVAVV